MLSRVRIFSSPLTVASQTPLSMGFSRQEYWSGLPFGAMIRQEGITILNSYALNNIIVVAHSAMTDFL